VSKMCGQNAENLMLKLAKCKLTAINLRVKHFLFHTEPTRSKSKCCDVLSNTDTCLF
jgi:hypothetical protein